jgi:hypothetical protein
MGLRLLGGPRATAPATAPAHGEPVVGDGPLGPVRRIDLPRITDPRGNLTFIESNRHAPFECRRVFYLYDVPGGEDRGGHAHRELQQLVIAASGSFDVSVDDGFRTHRYSLNRSYTGVYVPPMVWAQLTNFSSGSVALVLASEHYSEPDYYRDYDEFLRVARSR